MITGGPIPLVVAAGPGIPGGPGSPCERIHSITPSWSKDTEGFVYNFFKSLFPRVYRFNLTQIFFVTNEYENVRAYVF